MGGSTKQTTQSSAEPWKAAQPALTQSLTDADNIYKSGQGFGPYTGSTVVPYSQQSQQAMGDITNRAGWGQPAFDAQLNNVANNAYQGGLNSPQRDALAQMQGFSQGTGDVSGQKFQNIYDNAGGPSYSEQYLKDIASGGMLNRQDPNFERVLSRATENATTAGGMQAAANGRYGSASGQKAVATAVGDLEANARVGQYNAERGNQLTATGMLDQQRNAGFGNQMNAANSQVGVWNNNMDRRMNASGSAFNAGQQQQNNINSNTSALSDAYNASLNPAESRMGVGGMYEDLAGRTMNDQLRIWQGQQQAPKSAIEWLNAIGSGSGSLGGTQSGTAQGPKASPFGQVAGGLLGAASLFGGL